MPPAVLHEEHLPKLTVPILVVNIIQSDHPNGQRNPLNGRYTLLINDEPHLFPHAMFPKIVIEPPNESVHALWKVAKEIMAVVITPFLEE